eukprot:scaffold8492_cov71-Phaeocystis_antarctica.AAC.3
MSCAEHLNQEDETAASLTSLANCEAACACEDTTPVLCQAATYDSLASDAICQLWLDAGHSCSTKWEDVCDNDNPNGADQNSYTVASASCTQCPVDLCSMTTYFEGISKNLICDLWLDAGHSCSTKWEDVCANDSPGGSLMNSNTVSMVGCSQCPTPSPPLPSPSVVISFDFETDAIGTCPHGWTCTGSAAVQSVASLPDGCPIASGITARHVLSIGCDDDTGTATSSIFTLPAGIASLKFKRSGGADAPSGFYVKLEENNAVVAQSNDGTDTDNMFEVTLSLSDYAEQAVYIEVSDQQQSSWGKVAIDDIRFYNDQGESLDLITTSTPLKPPSPPPYTFTGTASLKTAVQ